MERGYLAHVKGKGETRGRNRHNNNSKIGAINLEERNSNAPLEVGLLL